MVRPLENCAARKVLFLLAVFFAFLVVARLGYGASDLLDLRVGVLACHARQLRDRVVRDEHAVVGPALNLLDLQGVHEASAQVRHERQVEVHALEQRAGGHLDADTGDGRRRDRSRRRSDGSNSDGRRSDERRSDGRRSDGGGLRGYNEARDFAHIEDNEHVLEVEHNNLSRINTTIIAADPGVAREP